MTTKQIIRFALPLLLALSACKKEDCAAIGDEDENGLADCADVEACGAEPQCDESGTCAAPFAVADPSTGTAGDNTGATNQMDGSCQSAGGLDVVFSVTPTGDLLEVTLSPAAADLGVFVIPANSCAGDGSEAADEIECQDVGLDGDPENLTAVVTPGQEVLVIVGGFAADDVGAFTLDISSRTITCGDGQIDGTENCDDANTTPGDGCDAACLEEDGFDCGFNEPSVCVPTCGDGFVDFDEECDDANLTAGDGCAADCTAEANFICDGNPSVCADISAECAAATAVIAGAGAGDATLGSDKFVPLNCGGGGGQENLFSFTANTASVTITITPVDPDGTFDPVVYAYLGNCVDLNELDCTDQGFSGDPETLLLDGTNGLPANGGALTIVVDSFSGGNEGAYTLTVVGQ